jgi:hypothetical protein
MPNDILTLNILSYWQRVVKQTSHKIKGIKCMQVMLSSRPTLLGLDDKESRLGLQRSIRKLNGEFREELKPTFLPHRH